MNNDLQSNINNINNLTNINEFNNLINECVMRHEMIAVVYIYDYIILNKYKPNIDTYTLINKLHSKTIKENRSLIIPDNGKRKLEPRRRIHKIMKGYNYSQALKNKDIVIKYINNNINTINYDGKNNKQARVLINDIKLNCNLSITDIRFIIVYLNRQQFFIKNNTNTNLNKNITNNMYKKHNTNLQSNSSIITIINTNPINKSNNTLNDYQNDITSVSNTFNDYQNDITRVNTKLKDIRNDKMNGNDKMNENVKKDITISTVNSNNNMNIYKFFPKIKH